MNLNSSLLLGSNVVNGARPNNTNAARPNNGNGNEELFFRIIIEYSSHRLGNTANFGGVIPGSSPANIGPIVRNNSNTANNANVRPNQNQNQNPNQQVRQVTQSVTKRPVTTRRKTVTTRRPTTTIKAQKKPQLNN